MTDVEVYYLKFPSSVARHSPHDLHLQPTRSSRATYANYNLTELGTVLKSSNCFIRFIEGRICLVHSGDDLIFASEADGVLELLERSHRASSQFNILQDFTHSECMWLSGRSVQLQRD